MAKFHTKMTVYNLRPTVYILELALHTFLLNLKILPYTLVKQLIHLFTKIFIL